MGFNSLKATEPLRWDNFLFTSKSPRVNGIRLIYLRRMKVQCILSYSYKLFRHLSLSRDFSQFSFKTVYVTIIGVNLVIYFRLPENSCSSRMFAHVLRQKFPPCSYHQPSPTPLDTNLVPPQPEKREEAMRTFRSW